MSDNLTTLDIHAGISTYKSQAFSKLIESVAVPLVIDNVVHFAKLVNKNVESDSWGETSIEEVVIQVGDQYFQIDTQKSSWDDYEGIAPWEINEVKPVTKTVTLYRQVPYEKEVTVFE